MNNLFYIPPTSSTEFKIVQMYDLKGSLLKRFVTDKQQNAGCKVLKDLNFCQHHEGTDNKGNKVKVLKGPCRAIRVGEGRCTAFIANLLNDVDFLRAHNIMDYSLLVGIATIPKNEGLESHKVHVMPYAEWNLEHGGLRSVDGDGNDTNCVYYLGIIDILQEFNMVKRLESAYKSRRQVLAGEDPNLISAVDSSIYGKRFVDFIAKHIR